MAVGGAVALSQPRQGRVRHPWLALGPTHFAESVTPVFSPVRGIAGGHKLSQRGFTYIYVLLLIALIGAGLAMVGTVWRTEVKRAKEAELLFIGHEFRQALASFHSRTPGGEKRYPKSLEDLLLDPRFPQSVRHLRRIYRDPMTGQTEWGLARTANGDIAGIYSLSTEKPMKVGGFTAEDEAFKGTDSYDQWVFAPAGALAEVRQEGEANLVSSQNGTN